MKKINKDLMAGALLIHNKLFDVIREARNEGMHHEDAIEFMFVDCISYFKKSGMSQSDFNRKCEMVYLFSDISFFIPTYFSST